MTSKINEHHVSSYLAELQLINEEEMVEIETRHLLTIIVVIDLGSGHQLNG